MHQKNKIGLQKKFIDHQDRSNIHGAVRDQKKIYIFVKPTESKIELFSSNIFI